MGKDLVWGGVGVRVNGTEDLNRIEDLKIL